MQDILFLFPNTSSSFLSIVRVEKNDTGRHIQYPLRCICARHFPETYPVIPFDLMDNPNHSARLRRCNSLPARLQRRSSLLPTRLRLTRNPYIGSFRHSPPTSFGSMEAGVKNSQHFYFTSSPQDIMRTSPYIGWFRHSPPSSVQLHKVDHRNMALSEKCQALAMILENLPKTDMSRPDFMNVINGRLCGGGKERDYNVRSTFHDSDNYSATINLLAKLGTWFLYPLAQDAESLYKACYYDRNLKLLTEDTRQVDDDSDSDSEDDDDTNESNNEEDDDDDSVSLSDLDKPVTPITNTPLTNGFTSKPADVSVSEIAEAYYAHQVMDQSEFSTLEGDRLDYVITQADIARMARNAARHLDVDSILNLPTTTYRPPRKHVKNPMKQTDSRGPDEAWSFIMVPDDTNKSLHIPGEEGASAIDTVCVICLEAFVDGDRLRVLPCNHSFHVGCIDRWLSGSHSHHECFTSGCPTCKKRPAVLPVPVHSSSRDQLLDNDGSVPSWAFAKLGSQMAQSSCE